jgi:hypothetical protein
MNALEQAKSALVDSNSLLAHIGGDSREQAQIQIYDNAAALFTLSSAETVEPDKELQLARLEAFAGQSGQAHLAQRLDEAVDLAAEAIELMTRFHSHAEPDDTPDMNAVFPALHFKNFVDDHARLMFKLNQFQRNPVDPAFLRLKKAADLVCAVMGAHGEISARDDRVSDLMNCLYATDPLTSVYADDVAAPQQAAQPAPAGMTDEQIIANAFAHSTISSRKDHFEFTKHGIVSFIRSILSSAESAAWPVEVQPDGSITPVDPADMGHSDLCSSNWKSSNGACNCTATLLARSNAPQPEADPQLLKFYQVETFPDLVLAMERHIEKLQSKLPPAADVFTPRFPRG